MSYTDHRKKVLEAMEDNSLTIVYAGHEIHTNEDDYYNFRVNSQFFWLTGLERSAMVLILAKVRGKTQEHLFIDEVDPLTERWTGKMPTKADASAVSGIPEDRIFYTAELAGAIDRYLGRGVVHNVYMDVWKYSREDPDDWNIGQAKSLCSDYPALVLKDLHELVWTMRVVKDEEEIDKVRKAINITRQGLEFVMQNLRPGKYEYQVKADFEYRCFTLGAKRMAFNTIAGSGINGCMMHYVENDRELQEGDLIVLDLGAKYGNYCSDITRTYPASGIYTPRQREYYELVLKANQAVKDAAKPGVTKRQLNDLVKKVLGEGLVAMGKIEDVSQVDKYYMHGCSHSIGIDVHDIDLDMEAPLEAGWIISDEPGLYIDEEAIGIRIEDDLLITDNGSVYLSADVLRKPDEIEKYMAEHRASI